MIYYLQKILIPVLQHDTWDDGWDGITVTILVNDVEIEKLTLEFGNTGKTPFTFGVNYNDVISLQWGGSCQCISLIDNGVYGEYCGEHGEDYKWCYVNDGENCEGATLSTATGKWWKGSSNSECRSPWLAEISWDIKDNNGDIVVVGDFGDNPSLVIGDDY